MTTLNENELSHVIGGAIARHPQTFDTLRLCVKTSNVGWAERANATDVADRTGSKLPEIPIHRSQRPAFPPDWT